jgi:hypothetical protein
MKRLELRDELAFLANFSANQASQDFVQTRLNKALDQAYNQEVERAKLNGSQKFFHMSTDSITWPVSTTTLAVPDVLVGKSIIDVLDITDGENGIPLVFGMNGQAAGTIFWKDHKTWQWSALGGPSSARTMRAIYEAVAEKLLNDDATPELVPAQFHMLIVWTAAILLRKAGDEMAPMSWTQERDEMRLDYYKHVARGRPTSHVARVIATGPNIGGTADNAQIDSVSLGAGLYPP